VRYLLDTHILVWWHLDDRQLSRRHRGMLADAQGRGEPLAVSSISLWEIAKLAEIGRLQFDVSLEECLASIEANPEIEILPISAHVAVESTRLGPKFPRDPADQLIAATAKVHGLTLATADRGVRSARVVPVI
jgi:PIN domain nuclease of toxin-antitoxin system